MKTELITKIVDRIESEINFITKKIEEIQNKHNDNFVFYFSWGYPKDLYKLSLKKNLLQETINFLYEKGNNEKFGEYIDYLIKSYKKQVLNGNFLGTSTEIFHNLAEMYKKEVYCDLINFYDELPK